LIAARQLRERGRQRDAHFESGDGEAEAAAWGVVIGEGSS
jgi:hypothetical protein